ncbi:atrial natriuretic peptide-converting enzyme [Ischnura elegans]|uniref:atrial natriuretic peptide-converting enzyme n=1 Tax=Ischnura elegans TaxID=197161 RepID=UPI001ED8727B|nr:atrial natriuretic peptide-converting enzyme [Ischnura elegans]
MTADVVPKSGRRKPSLESKFSISPSSYSATGSEDALRFTRKLSVRRYYRWSFTFLSAFLLILLIAASSVYLGYTYLGNEEGSTEKVFRVSMRILGWDGLKQWLGRRGTDRKGQDEGAELGGGGVGVVLPPHQDNEGKPDEDGLVHSYRDPVHLIDTPHLLRTASRDLRERVNLIFRRSKVRSAFVGSKVVALHGLGDGDLGFHSEIIFDTKWLDNESGEPLNAANVHRILEQELFPPTRVYFANITVDPKSLYVQEEGAQVETTTSAQSREETTMTPEPPRWCEEGKLKYCAVGNGAESVSTLISYPNVFNHKSIAEVMQDLITFRETVDSECHPLAHFFFCSLLQPPCWEVEQTTEIGEASSSVEKGPVLPLPCRSFCEELSSACGDRIPPKLWSKVNCQSYPENGTCIQRPGCVAELSGRSLSHLLCDGLPDCQDRADETLEKCSSSCSSKQDVFHCDEGDQGGMAKCVEKHKRCDGVEDCARGGDEKGCVFFKSETSETSGGPAEVMVIHHGELYTICGDEETSSLSQNTSNEEIASWVCNKLHQGDVRSLKLSLSSSKHFLRPTAGLSSFVPTSCPSGRTLHLKCHRRECGLQPMLIGHDNQLRGKDSIMTAAAALPGDWPWQAVLLKDGRHVCDATLVSPHWILTAASCFDGFRPPTLSWMVRLGALRPTGSQHPWLQETSLVGMVTSPVGGLALGRLTNPIKSDNYIGVACLPELADNTQKGGHVSLSWGVKGDRLEPINLNLVPCSNSSSEFSRTVCAEEVYSDSKKSCSAMQLPGAPLLQQTIHLDDSQQMLPKWTVLGVETGRIATSNGVACGKLEFEGIKGSLDWIRHTIEGISQASADSSSGGRR